MFKVSGNIYGARVSRLCMLRPAQKSPRQIKTAHAHYLSWWENDHFQGSRASSQRTRVELDFSSGKWSPTIGLSNATNHNLTPDGLYQRQLIKVRALPAFALPGPQLV
jgi:hypothetical protein